MAAAMLFMKSAEKVLLFETPRCRSHLGARMQRRSRSALRQDIIHRANTSCLPYPKAQHLPRAARRKLCEQAGKNGGHLSFEEWG